MVHLLDHRTQGFSEIIGSSLNTEAESIRIYVIRNVDQHIHFYSQYYRTFKVKIGYQFSLLLVDFSKMH